MKKYSVWTKIALLALSLLMLLTAFAGCTSEEEGEATSGKPIVTENPYDEDGYLKDGIPDGLNFNREFTIFCGQEQAWGQGTDPDNTQGIDLVRESIFSRNEMVQERLGIEIKWVLQKNFQGSDQTVFMQKIDADIQGAHEFDSIVSYNLLPYTLAQRGYCVNLADTKYIDLTGPWWPSVFIERLICNDQVYALVANSDYQTLQNLSGVFFNKNLVEDYQIENPYTLVDNDEWNVAKLKELIKGTYQDRNNNSKADNADQFGLATSTQARLTCWYFGMGVKLVTKNGDGELELTASDEHTGQVIDTIIDLFATDDSFLVDTGNTNSDFKMFMEERAVFYQAVLYLTELVAEKNLEINYGAVPHPKLDSAQEQYYTHIPNNHPIWYIPTSAEDIDCSSALVECMASQAYRQVEPVYYDTCVKLRLAPDERLAEMYDLMRQSITFDFNFVFRFVVTKDIDTQIRNCIANPSRYKWATVWEEIRVSAENDFQKILDTYAERDTQ